eukprot:2538857-Rhodomonas_salina.1
MSAANYIPDISSNRHRQCLQQPASARSRSRGRDLQTAASEQVIVHLDLADHEDPPWLALVLERVDPEHVERPVLLAPEQQQTSAPLFAQR